MPRNVEYKFDLDQPVVTPFGDDGMITMLGFDDGGPTYFVRTKENPGWFKEKHLVAK